VKLKDHRKLLFLLFPSLLSTYVFINVLPWPKALVMIPISSMFFFLNRGSSIRTIVLLPFEFIAITVASLALKVGFNDILVFLFFSCGLMFLSSLNIAISLSGLMIMGIFLTIHGNKCSPMLNFLVFAGVIVGWLILKERLNRRILLMLIFSALLVLSLFGSFQFRSFDTLINAFKDFQRNNSVQSEPNKNLTENLKSVNVGGSTLKSNNDHIIQTSGHLSYIAFKGKYIEILISLFLVIGGFFLIFIATKVIKSSSIRLKSIVFSFLYLFVLVGFLILIFSWFENYRANNPILGINPITSVRRLPMILEFSPGNILLPEKQKGINSGFEMFFIRTLEVFGTVGLTVVAVYLLFYFFRFTREFNIKNEDNEKKYIPQGIEMLPLDQIPTLKYTKDYILAAYWWLRRKYFGSLDFLTPYELLDKVKKVDYINQKNFKFLTESYVLVHFGNKKLSKMNFKRFDKNLREIVDDLENLDQIDKF